MLGRVPSFARCFFHFQRNSGFMKILYSLLKYVCVCVHMRSTYLADRTCLKQLDLTRSFLQFVIPTLSTHEKQLSNFIHICIWGEQGLSGKVNPPGKQALLWKDIEVFPFPPSFFPCLHKFFENHWFTEMNLLPFSQAVLQKNCFSLPSFWKTLRGWEAGIIFPAKYLEYLQYSYFRLPGKSRASVS